MVDKIRVDGFVFSNEAINLSGVFVASTWVKGACAFSVSIFV